MSTRTLVLRDEVVRQRAIDAVRAAPVGMVVKIAPQTRTLEQNALMWSLLGEVSRQLKWHGQFLTSQNWKDICTAAIRRQDVVPGIDGGFVVLGTSTSRMTKSEMSELCEFVLAFGAQHGVVFDDVMEAA